MSFLQLRSGERGRIEIIPRKQAIEILSQPSPRKTWFGEKYRSAHRTSRGPGPAADHINYGLMIGHKCRAVIRLGNAPWGNRPVMAAVGTDLASTTVYLSRLWAAGIASEDLVAFIRQVNCRFPHDLLVRHPERPPYRYLLSLDSMAGWIIEDPQGNIFESPPVAGRIYHQAGALYAGTTTQMKGPTRYLKDGRVRSIYQDGRTLRAELAQQEGISLVADGPKHRFVFVLAEENSPEYAIYRTALPPWVRSFEWGEGSLGWIQPRLLIEGRTTNLLLRLRQSIDLTQPTFVEGL